MNPVKNKDPNIFFDYISLMVRQFRLYYKSWPLFKESLITPLQAIYFPFLPNHKWVDIRFKSGRNILISAIHWKLLPSACRLDNIGVDFEFQKNAKLTRIDGLHIYSPLWTKNEAIYFKEVFFDDVYKVKKRNFKKSIVVDIGAYVGDSALAFARQGAKVHAVEPSEVFCKFIRRNFIKNGLDNQLILHKVGLASAKEKIKLQNDTLHFAEGIDYTLKKLPRNIDLLKMDCEGAEYYLLADNQFLSHLQPKEIQMEYHNGAKPILLYLKNQGYKAYKSSGSKTAGIIKAYRIHDFSN
jgi:hypothetical protein